MLRQLISCFVFVPLFLQAQQGPVIEGRIPGCHNCKVRLVVPADPLSSRQEVLDESATDTSGFFRLSSSDTATMLYSVELDFFKDRIVMSGTDTFRVVYDTVPEGPYFRPFYMKEPLERIQLTETGPALNQLRERFENELGQVLRENLSGRYMLRNISFLRDFESQPWVDSLAKTDPWLDNWIKYRLAGIKVAVSPAVRDQLLDSLMDTIALPYRHPAFAGWLQTVFAGYLNEAGHGFDPAEIRNLILSGDFAGMVDHLGADSLLRKERTRELAILANCPSWVNEQLLPSPAVENLLDFMAAHSRFPEHRTIAENLSRQMFRFTSGKPAPGFKLPDSEGEMISLDEYAGKPLYLSFIVSWSHGCLVELPLLDSLYTRYGNSITFITISMDQDFALPKKLWQERHYSWPLLYGGTDYRFIDSYGILTFPLFVLIDSEGKIYDYPAYKPSEIISQRFDALLQMERVRK